MSREPTHRFAAAARRHRGIRALLAAAEHEADLLAHLYIGTGHLNLAGCVSAAHTCTELGDTSTGRR
jgi:hypothetical protein